MRPLPGFERPLLQWMFVCAGLVLIAVAAAEGVVLRRMRGTVAQLRTASLSGRLDREQLERTLSREQAARESFALEVGRLRGSAPNTASTPTLTLWPLTTRRSTPPDASVAAPAAGQVIYLRLLLPAGRVSQTPRYAVALRSWSGGSTVWSRGNLPASVVDGKAAVVTLVTGDLLAPGAYEIALTEVAGDGGTQEIGYYEIGVRPSDAR